MLTLTWNLFSVEKKGVEENLLQKVNYDFKHLWLSFFLIFFYFNKLILVKCGMWNWDKWQKGGKTNGNLFWRTLDGRYLIPSKTLLYTVDISGMELIMPPGEKPNIVSFKHYPYMSGFLMCSAIRWPTHASTFRCTKCINLLVDGPVATPEGAHGMNGLPSIMVDSLYCVWKSRERENISTLSCVSFSFRYFR